ncbi:MAG: polysaccharide deacetylase family protein, partial [Solirubrobacteraceae bacterium]
MLGHDRLVLCYHGVSREWPAVMAIHPERLERQVGMLLERGYVPATFTQAVLDPPAPRTLAVTFDDACRSVLEHGGPILRRLGVPATLFVPTAYIGAAEPMAWPGVAHWLDTPHRDELLPLDWSEITSLQAAGWEIGSHTRTHPRLTGLDDARLAEELAGSRAEIEARLGRACGSLAYPFG